MSWCKSWKKGPLKWWCFNGPFFGVVLSCLLLFGVGGFLLSHNLPVAVPSARAGLASGFGMGPGVSLLLLATDKLPGHFLAVGVVSDTV